MALIAGPCSVESEEQVIAIMKEAKSDWSQYAKRWCIQA